MNGMRMNGSKGLRLAWPRRDRRGRASDMWGIARMEGRIIFSHGVGVGRFPPL